MSLRRKQAEIQLAVGSEPRARATAAERLRDRCDDAEFSRTVQVAPSLRDLAEVIRAEWLDRPFPCDALHNFASGYHILHAPAVRRADIHVFDETHDVIGSAEVTSHLHDAVFVDSALDHHVDLDRPQARFVRRIDRFEYAVYGEVDIVHGAKDAIVERVEADADAMKTGILQCPGLLPGQE